ncbi:MAG: hypothetical protein RSB23_06005 [Alistipes sp.]
MKYYFLLLLSALLLHACIDEDTSGCPTPTPELEVLLRVTGSYTSDDLDKLDLWIEQPHHNHWLRVRNYTVEEIAGKDYIAVRLPADHQYNMVAVGNAKSASVVVAPLPQDCLCDDTQQGFFPSANSTVSYAAHPFLPNGYQPVDNLFMSLPTPLSVPRESAMPVRADIPIDRVVSLVKLIVNTNSLTGQKVTITVFDTASGRRFNAEHLAKDRPVYNAGTITGTGYVLNTIIFPSVNDTADIDIRVEVTNEATGEVIPFHVDNLHIAAKQVYIITFDGITFDVRVEDWNGTIEIELPLT